MSTRAITRLNSNLSRAIKLQNTRRVHTYHAKPLAVGHRSIVARPSVGAQRRAVSNIPEDFDLDQQIPTTNRTKVEDVSPNPFPEPSNLNDAVDEAGTNWAHSFHGLSVSPFPKEITDILLTPIEPGDIEIKPDGLIYLPEIKYRRIMNRAFGPGGWGLAPRGEVNVSARVVSREYALVCLGRLVAIARGEQEYFDPAGIATATEACKSNALMRCCKDLGIASELWDPRFIREFKSKYCVDVFVEHLTTKKKRKLWRRKEDKFDYPYKE